jgi:hypothetical protein
MASRSALTRSRALQQRGHVVGGDHVAPATGGRERGIAVTGGDVEHLLTGADVEGVGLAQLFADDLQGGSDDGVVARGPREVLARLERLEVGLARAAHIPDGGGCLHDSSPFWRRRPRRVVAVRDGDDAARRPWVPAWEWPWNLTTVEAPLRGLARGVPAAALA